MVGKLGTQRRDKNAAPESCPMSVRRRGWQYVEAASISEKTTGVHGQIEGVLDEDIHLANRALMVPDSR